MSSEIFATFKNYNFIITSGKFEPYYDVSRNKLNKNFKFNTSNWKANPIFDTSKSAHALLTGKISGVTAIDIDDPTIESNIKLMSLCEKTCNMIQRTRKGYHYIFKYTPNLKTTVSEKYKLDIRNDNALLYIEPSIYKFEQTTYKYEFIKTPKDKEDINEISEEILNYIYSLFNFKETKQHLQKIKEINKLTTKELKTIDTKKDLDINKIRFILDNLNESRFDNFNDWLYFGIICRNENIDVEIFEEYSKKSKKYIEGEPSNFYYSLKPNIYDLHINTLYYWLKQDNKTKFIELINKDNNDYEKIKQKIEEKYFLVGSRFYKKLDNRCGFEILKESDIKIQLKPYKIEVFDEDKNKRIKIDFYNKWINDKQRKSFEKTDFFPNPKECPENTYNLFDGFEAENYLNLIKDYTDDQINENIEPFLKHINILTNNDSTYFIKWLANIIQTPNIKQGTTPLFRDKGNFLTSGGGTGKNLFFDSFGKKILGEKYYLTIATNQSLFSSFNEHLENKLLVCIEEAEGKANFSNFNTLKANISQSKCLVNRKGIPKYEINDYTRYIFCSNNDNPIPIDNNDRRFFCYDVNSEKRGDIIYFNKLSDSFNNNISIACFFKYLKNIKIYESPIEYQINRPINELYKELKRINAPSIIKWLITLTKNTDLIIKKSVSELYDDYNSWLEKTKNKNNEITINYFSRFLTSDKDIFTHDDIKKYKDNVIKITLNLKNIKTKLIEKDYIDSNNFSEYLFFE